MKNNKNNKTLKAFLGLIFLALWNRQKLCRLCFQQTASNTGYQNTALR